VQRVIAGHDRCIHDTLASLLYGKLFERFPMLRLATIELGCAWVPELLANLERAGRGDLDEDPIETFQRHVWVTPFENEDLLGLADDIGIDRIMFGSDFPHMDGLAEPATYADALKGFDDDAIRKIMRDNARDLVSTSAGS
jgi:predicted TIM-barrel fold metal-dependent hydrolase